MATPQELSTDGEVATSHSRIVPLSYATLFFWGVGILLLLSSLLCTVLLVVVPLFGLENERWQHPDTHVTLSNAILHLNVGVLCILAARGSTKTRLLLGFIAALTLVGLGTRNLGIISW